MTTPAPPFSMSQYNQSMALLATPSCSKGIAMIDRTKNEYVRLAGEIDAVLSDKTNPAIRARISLRDAVCAFVDAERQRGTTRKNVIQTVKAILTEAEQRASPAYSQTDGSDSQLSKQLVDWCIEFHRKAHIAPVARLGEA